MSLNTILIVCGALALFIIFCAICLVAQKEVCEHCPYRDLCNQAYKNGDKHFTPPCVKQRMMMDHHNDFLA